MGAIDGNLTLPLTDPDTTPIRYHAKSQRPKVPVRRSRNQRKNFQPRMDTDKHGWKTNFFLSYLCASVSIRGKKSSQKHATLQYCTAKGSRSAFFFTGKHALTLCSLEIMLLGSEH